MQCYNGRKGYGRLGRAEAESRRGPVAGFDLCYAMQSNRETARIKAARWKQPAGGVEVVVLHRGGGSEGRRDESHAFLARAVAVRRAIRITNTRAEKERGGGRERGVRAPQTRQAGETECTLATTTRSQSKMHGGEHSSRRSHIYGEE